MDKPPPGTRVLVADDDPAILDLLLTRLDLAGYEGHGARDGRGALARVRELKPAALVLDVNMPGLDGFGVLRRLREAGQIPGLPVMVLTARNQQTDVRQAIELGAKDFLSKPFEDEHFLLRIARLLRVRRLSLD